LRLGYSLLLVVGLDVLKAERPAARPGPLVAE
jgi:hypothetical protein